MVALRTRLSPCSRLAISPVAAMMLLCAACDSLPGVGDGPSSDNEDKAQASPDKTLSEAKAADDATKATPDKPDAKASAEDEAKAAALKEAQAKALAEQEAKEAADAEAKLAAERAKALPVVLSDLTAKHMGGFFSSTGMIEVRAQATLNQALGNATYVHVKSLCKDDAQFVADVGYLNAHYSKPLEKYAVGDKAEVTGNLYSQGLTKALSPCQLEFRVGGLSGGLSVPIGHACWDGSTVTNEKCSPPLHPAAMSGAALPIEVQSLDVQGASMGSSNGLKLSYMLGIMEPQDNSVRLTFKSACTVGDKTFVDLGQANLSAGPFRFEAGETVARAANLYWSDAFGFADTPDKCDIGTSLWKMKAGSFGEYEEVRLRDSCFEKGKLRTGRCDPTAPAAVPPVTLSEKSVTVGDVALELTNPYGTTDKFQLKIRADVEMAEAVGQNDGINAKVSCKAGKEKRVETAYLFGVELHYLQPGETTRMTANAFGGHPLEVEPKSCLVEFFGGPRFSPTGAEGANLGKFCLKKGKIKKGGKC